MRELKKITMSFIQFSKNRINRHRKSITRVLRWSLAFIAILVTLSFFFGGKILEKNNYKAKKTSTLDYDFVSSIYFNDSDGSLVYRESIISALLSAEKSIHIAMYSISDTEIIRLLDDKKSQGIDVEVIVPKSKGKQHGLAFALTSIEPLEAGEVSLGTETADNQMNGELMHHKFIVVDPGTANQKVVFSSLNLTRIQEKYDPGFILKSTDPSLVEGFYDEFVLLKKNKYGLKKLSSGEFKPFSFRGEYSNGFVELWFGPGYIKNSIKYRLLDEIQEAATSIKVIGWRINDRDIFNALARRAKKVLRSRFS